MPVQKITNAIQAAHFTIKFRDIFSLKGLYVALHEWFLEYEWSSADSKGDVPDGKDYWETLYLEKEGQKGDKEMWWWWRLQKLPTGNSYYKYHIDMDFHIVYMLPTEVVRDGKKFKANKGEVEIKLWAYLEFDYQNQWSKHPILKMFNLSFPKRIYKNEIYESHKLELYRESYILQNYIKKWFKLKTFLPYEEITPFHPPETYPEWKKE